MRESQVKVERVGTITYEPPLRRQGSRGGFGFLLSQEWSAGDLVHSHPTLSEAVKEAALAANGEAIHI